jgi:hypothetical protein
MKTINAMIRSWGQAKHKSLKPWSEVIKFHPEKTKFTIFKQNVWQIPLSKCRKLSNIFCTYLFPSFCRIFTRFKKIYSMIHGIRRKFGVDIIGRWCLKGCDDGIWVRRGSWGSRSREDGGRGRSRGVRGKWVAIKGTRGWPFGSREGWVLKIERRHGGLAHHGIVVRIGVASLEGNIPSLALSYSHSERR